MFQFPTGKEREEIRKYFKYSKVIESLWILCEAVWEDTLWNIKKEKFSISFYVSLL